MSTEVTNERVEGVIAEGLAEIGAEPEKIGREATLEELDVDSLDLVEISQIVEDEFGVVLEADDIKDLRTVGDVIDLVVSRSS